MYYNGKYDGAHVASFLGVVHKQMVSKYSNKNAKEKANAQILQQFFQELKLAAAGHSTNNFVNAAILDQILVNIQAHSPGRFKIQNLFRGTGGSYRQGKRFEDELTRVVLAVLENISLDSAISKEQINIGGKSGAPAEVFNAIDKMGKEVTWSIGEAVTKELEREVQESSDNFYTKRVQGKIDVRGYNVQVKANANERLLLIYDLLKDATFSAKSYASMTWDEKVSSITSLNLGKAHYYRAFSGPLLGLGYDKKTTDSAIFAGRNALDNDVSVAQHFYHLRYIYELTGSGIVYNNGQFLGEVKYLIYNDPATDNIYVKSTSEILEDVLNGNPEFTGDPFNTTIHISKMKFLS